MTRFVAALAVSFSIGPAAAGLSSPEVVCVVDCGFSDARDDDWIARDLEAGTPRNTAGQECPAGADRNICATLVQNGPQTVQLFRTR